MSAAAGKLVLVVVDAMHPGILRKAIDAGEAPLFGALAERGAFIDDCVSSFPSVTPVCSSEIMTGSGPDRHGVIGMNWFHRVERRYIEYGSSFEATRTCGLFRSMYDLVYNMNLEHLSWEAETLFEQLGDAGVRGATTPFLIYRGRTRHELGLEGLAKRAVAVANFRHAVWAPQEFFYGDLYASRPTGCAPSFTRPGLRDDYATCVAEALVREDAYDFLVFALPDNDFHSHRFGPEQTVDSISKADACVARFVEAAGGLDEFLAGHAVIVTSDHAQSPVTDALDLAELMADDWQVLTPGDENPDGAELAVSPTSRAGGVYLLDSGPRYAQAHRRMRERLNGSDGVDLVAWLADADGEPVARRGVGLNGSAVEAVVEHGDYRLQFRPGGPIRDERGVGWQLTGRPEALAGEITAGRFDTQRYPDGLARLFSALTSPHAGDALVSAADGFEFVDWGGVDHVGGGSHGALSREDSLCPLILCGCGPPDAAERPWALRDIAAVVLEHFGATRKGPGD